MGESDEFCEESQLFDPLFRSISISKSLGSLTKGPTIDVAWFSSPAALGPSDIAMDGSSERLFLWVKIWFFDVDQTCRFTMVITMVLWFTAT